MQTLHYPVVYTTQWYEQFVIIVIAINANSHLIYKCCSTTELPDSKQSGIQVMTVDMEK